MTTKGQRKKIARQLWVRTWAMHSRRRKLALLSLVGVLALGLIALASATGAELSEAQQGAMHNCPQAGKWAVSVWDDGDGTNASQALNTCDAGAVAVAYSIDPDTQMWSRWFADRPQLSNLQILSDMQGVIALGAVDAPPPTVGPTPALSGRIVFSSDRDGNDDIYVMNADGTGQTRLTNNPAWDSQPVWAPDGSKIAFVSDRDGNDEIYVMNADGTGQTRLTSNEADDYGPVWSPDGSKMAFFSDRDANSEVYVMNADGTGQTNLTKNPAADTSPAWSPDGSKIAFHSDRDDNYEVYAMGADGTNQTNLTNNVAWDGKPACSP